jgi:hypothetical protein
MEIKEAMEVKDIVLEATRNIDLSIAQLAKTEDKRLAIAYKKIAGQVMGLLFTNILQPLYSTFPALTPEELRDNSPVPKLSLTPQAVALLGQLVVHLRQKLEVVDSKVAGSSLVTEGNIQEVADSIAHLELFLRRQNPT